MAEIPNSGLNLLHAYLWGVIHDLECENPDDEANLQRLLNKRSSLSDCGIPDAELKRMCDIYDQNEYYQATWPDLRPLRQFYLLHSQDAWCDRLWRLALSQAAWLVDRCAEEEQQEVLQALQEYHQQHADDPGWQTLYYEAIKGMADNLRGSKELMPRLIALWTSLPADQDAFAQASMDFLEKFPFLIIGNEECPSVIAALYQALQPYLSDEALMREHTYICLDALVTLSEHQNVPETEENLRLMQAYAEEHEQLYAKMLCYAIAARYRAHHNLQQAVADLEELKALAAASHAMEEDGQTLASLVLECCCLLLLHASDPVAPEIMNVAEDYLREIGFVDVFASEQPEANDHMKGASAEARQTDDDAFPAHRRTIVAMTDRYGDMLSFYVRMLFQLLDRENDALQARAKLRLRSMQRVQPGLFYASLNYYLIGLDYPQMMRLAEETFADFPDQEQLLHAIVYEMEDEPLHGRLSYSEAEQCLRFMRDCLQRFPRHYSFFRGFTAAAQGMAVRLIEQGEPFADILQEMRALLQQQLDLQRKQHILEEITEDYLHTCAAIAMSLHGDQAISLLNEADAFRRSIKKAPLRSFMGENALDRMWDEVRRNHPDKQVSEAIRNRKS